MKIVCISDTHTKEKELKIPTDVDMIIFAGDAGSYRDPEMNRNGILDFIDWYASLKIKYKIWVAGNHDTSIERGLVDAKALSKEKGLIYLEHEACEVEGIKIFGSPYTPEFGYGWAYNVPRGELYSYWNEIPLGTDILITHGPPYGIGDFVPYNGGEFVGCHELLDVIITKLTSLKYSISGHIHYSYGVVIKNNVTFVNASVVNEGYRVVNKPIIIEIEK